jgi:hypothetical protein
MMSQLDKEADDLLRELAKREGKSLRQLGINDERRQRTIRERETTFSDYFGRRKRE